MNTSRSLDFPIWVPSALVKELRQGLRTPTFILLVSLFPTLLSFFFLFSFIINPLEGKPFISPDGCQAIFWITMVVTLLFIMPLRASSSIRDELLSRNNELLLLTRQGAGRIVLGKWISFMAQSLLIVFISLPFFLIRYYYGEINLVQDVTVFSLLYLGSGILTAYTLWASAMPSLLRTIAFFLLGIGVVILSSNYTDLNLFREGPWDGILLAFLILADAFLVISSLLLLAREWFSPAAQNTAAPLRKLLLAFFAASIIPLAFLENASSAIQDIMTGNFIFMMIYGAFLMIVNLTDPAYLLPIHVEKMNNKKFSRLQKLLFLPGLPGGVFFTLLLSILTALAVYLVDRIMVTSKFQSLQMLFCLTVSVWYGITMPAMLLKPLWKKLKNNTLLAYALIWLILFLVLNVLDAIHMPVPLLPGGYLYELLDEKSLPPFSKFSLFSLMDLAAGIAMLSLTNKHWFDVFRNSSSSPRRKPENVLPEQE